MCTLTPGGSHTLTATRHSVHSQGVVHRDIKPDNLLLTEDDVLKIVDFGVSEMFEKDDEMRTAKPAGSPAFLPPELCVAKHGDVSGRAADLWSMGVSLYCLRYGKIPFERDNVLDMYEAIKTETPKFPPDVNSVFLDLMSKLMEKDPEKRITMAELRVRIDAVLRTARTTADSAGTSMGHQERHRSSPQRRRELRRPSRPPQLTRTEPCLHSEDEPLDLRCKLLLAFPRALFPVPALLLIALTVILDESDKKVQIALETQG